MTRPTTGELQAVLGRSYAAWVWWVRRMGSKPCHPFDRLLIAQALDDRLTIVTADPEFGKHPVRTIW